MRWPSLQYQIYAVSMVLLLFNLINGCQAIVIDSEQQYFIKNAGGRTGCGSEGVFMGYLNKTCSTGVTGPVYGPTVGPLLRSASSANTWRSFTIKKVGETDQNEDLVEIKTSYPKSSEKPKCSGYVVPEKEESCKTADDGLADKVHIHAEKGSTWVLSSVEGKIDTYTIRAYSRKAGCHKYLAASSICNEPYLHLETKNNGAGLEHWTIIAANPSQSPSPTPPPRVLPPPPPSPKVVEQPPPPPPSEVLPSKPYQLSAVNTAADGAVIIYWKDGITAAARVEERYQVRCLAFGNSCSATPIASSVGGIARGVQAAGVGGILLNSPLTCYVVAISPVSNTEVCSDPLILTPPSQPKNLYAMDTAKNSWWGAWEEGTIAYPEELYTLKCVKLGAGCTDSAVAVSDIIPRGIKQVNVSNLPDEYYVSCYVIAHNGAGSVCSPEARVFLPSAPSTLPGTPTPTPTCPTTFTTCNSNSVCTDTDLNNCGSCNNQCFTGTDKCGQGTCQCNDGVFTFPAVAGTCGVQVSGFANQAVFFTVTSAGTITFTFDAFSIPDRFVIKQGTICGPTIYDSGFRGQAIAGCAESAPCCTAANFPAVPACAAPGPDCPAGTGAGTANVPVTPGVYYIMSYGVCSSTGYQYTFSC